MDTATHATAAARVLVLVLKLCEKLCEPAPQYGSAARILGVTGTDMRIGRPNYAGPPEDDALAHAIVVGRPEDGVVAEIELWPAAGAGSALAPQVLRAALGPPQAVPKALAGPRPPETFIVERRGRACVVLASVDDDGRVTDIVIRRVPV